MASRPQVERYVRCSVDLGEWTVDAGLEYLPGERLGPLQSALRGQVMLAASETPSRRLEAVPGFNAEFEAAVSAAWPGRAWFVEVHHGEDAWTQVFQPFGLPRGQE